MKIRALALESFLILSVAALLVPAEVAIASGEEVAVTEDDFAQDPVYSPYVDRAYPDQVFFGDTHFHAEVSFDAGLIGTNIDIHDAFRFARGEQIASNTGQPVQLIRPLDFLAVTEHAEFNGLATALRTSDPLLLSDPWGRSIHEKFNSGQEGRMAAFQEIIHWGAIKRQNPFEGEELSRSIWVDSVKIADQYNESGRFTTLMGFEWTSSPDGDNLHRIVLFEDGAERTSQTLPFSMFDSEDPEGLWAYMATYEEKVGGRVFALPHNGNLSNGRMFTGKTYSGEPIDRAYAEARARWEPLHEMTQIKGDEETHPFLSPDDEFADFESWDVANISGTVAKEDWMLQFEHARSALKMGLELGQELGANPYKFGLVGANLDRIQIIKGWLDAEGELHGRIYDVAVSDGRAIGADGRCKPPVGNSVDIPTATFTNTIGDAILAAHWTDPDFDVQESAFYYVRVLEIPTPRWTTYDAVFFGIPLPDTVTPTIQDRAYTSPIWYTL